MRKKELVKETKKEVVKEAKKSGVGKKNAGDLWSRVVGTMLTGVVAVCLAHGWGVCSYPTDAGDWRAVWTSRSCNSSATLSLAGNYYAHSHAQPRQIKSRPSALYLPFAFALLVFLSDVFELAIDCHLFLRCGRRFAASHSFFLHSIFPTVWLLLLRSAWFFYFYSHLLHIQLDDRHKLFVTTYFLALLATAARLLLAVLQAVVLILDFARPAPPTSQSQPVSITILLDV